MRKLIFHILILFFSFLFVILKNKKTDPTSVENLEEFSVIATKTVRQLSSLPLPVQIVSEKEIEAISSIRLNDILMSKQDW